MKNLILITILAPVILFGCATTDDVNNLQSQISATKDDVNALFEANTNAKYAAERANRQADRALQAGQAAELMNQQLNEKVTRRLNR